MRAALVVRVGAIALGDSVVVVDVKVTGLASSTAASVAFPTLQLKQPVVLGQGHPVLGLEVVPSRRQGLATCALHLRWRPALPWRRG